MKTSIEHLPQNKQAELKSLVEVVSRIKKVEKIILFGSHAKGNWVEDQYIEDGVLYEYKSDYDFLIVLRHEDFSIKSKIESLTKSEFADKGLIITPLSFIFHGITYLNHALTVGNYFFQDIKNEGILLYDSGNYNLAIPKKMSPQEAQSKAKDYFEQWYNSANDFLRHCGYAIKDKSYHKAAFELHQATERYYTTILLVYTDYRPKDHNLSTLGVKVEMCDKRFSVFPNETNEDERLFELLKKAYIDARYKMKEYSITKSELEYLSKCVSALKDVTKELCEMRIEEIGKK